MSMETYVRYVHLARGPRIKDWLRYKIGIVQIVIHIRRGAVEEGR